jgi:hypothetical protein
MTWEKHTHLSFCFYDGDDKTMTELLTHVG